MNREELVKALRTSKLDGENPIEWVHLICDAADMLENDQRCMEALRAELDKWKTLGLLANKRADDYRAMRAERDAAVAWVPRLCLTCSKDIEQYLSDGKRDDYCDTCRRNRRCNWTWNGKKKEA